MAFDKKIFETRASTAIVFVIVMALGLLLNRWSFFILFSVIHFGCWMEYQRLVGLIDKEYQQISPFHKYGVMIAGWCIMLWFTNDGFNIFGLRLHELGWWIGLLFIFVLPIMELMLAKTVRLKNIGHSAFGLVYISLSLGLLTGLYGMGIYIYDRTDSPNFATRWSMHLVIIGALWINDTMAYIIGSLIGKHPLSGISPKKTWEGTVGGLVLTIAIAGFIAYLLEVDIVRFMTIAGIAGVAGTFGDLLESKIKRLADVKDSGTMMPGHGGFLDRFDSMLVAIPFVWLYLIITT
ncbi:MAG TPA: phosphatidate cytidylyltransferase [Chitinophagaceae bacterium]|nr:phosphatidate cytidylyltransferase [Chitinophagaceae bacterium]